MSAVPKVSLEENIRRMTPVSVPPEQRAEVNALRDALEKIAHPPRATGPGKCKLVGPRGEAIMIPSAVFYVLERVAEVMAQGNAVTVVPVGKELTTQQAADILNVSRQYLVRLLDEGRIPFDRTGKHRRVRVGDLLAFREKRDRARIEKLQELTRMSQELGGYEDIE